MIKPTQLLLDKQGQPWILFDAAGLAGGRRSGGQRTAKLVQSLLGWLNASSHGGK